MTLDTMSAGVDDASLGQRRYDGIAELYPLCRSLTSEGVRETLRRLRRVLPLTVHEVAPGTPVFDWIVPKEWSIRDAWVKNVDGARMIDFLRSNLHVVSGSVPVRRCMSLAELRPRLHRLPDRPEWIPLPSERVFEHSLLKEAS